MILIIHISTSWGKKILFNRYNMVVIVKGYHNNGLPNLKLVNAKYLSSCNQNNNNVQIQQQNTSNNNVQNTNNNIVE